MTIFKTSRAESIESAMKKVCTSINSKCVIMVEEITRLDSTTIPIESKELKYFYTINPAQQDFLNFVLRQYIATGIGELDGAKLSDLLKLKYDAPKDVKVALGRVKAIREAFYRVPGIFL